MIVGNIIRPIDVDGVPDKVMDCSMEEPENKVEGSDLAWLLWSMLVLPEFPGLVLMDVGNESAATPRTSTFSYHRSGSDLAQAARLLPQFGHTHLPGRPKCVIFSSTAR